MRTVLAAHPNSELTQRIHDEAAESFEGLFLAGRGDALPAIDALSLFYDYRELTPIGRRGDEMIRRLADRLVGVDLPTRRPSCCSTRSTTGCRAPRARRWRRGSPSST
jgi:hypothetical protein